jgi:hypothetical protein
MKSLNDALREEFYEILKSPEFEKKIHENDLDKNVLFKAFDVLLDFKSNPDLIDKGRSEFENYLINYIRVNKDKI